MKESTKRFLSIGFIVLTLGILLFIVFSNNEFSNIVQVFSKVKLKWIAVCFLCLFAYFAMDALGTYLYLCREKQKISYFCTLRTAIIGAYYSNITPGASGGQPMQIYYMNKYHVPIGVATSALSIKLFFTQLGTLVVTFVLWFFNRSFFNQQLGGVKGIILVGITINAAVVPVLILAVVNEKSIKKFFTFLLRLGQKLRLIKNFEKAQEKTYKTLEGFHQSAAHAFSSPRIMFEQALCGTLQMFFYMAIAYGVYKAFGLRGIPWYQIILISYMVFLSASYMPLPGGSGAQEGGFYLYYKGIFPEGEIGLALLVWRFFTFYFTVILGSLITVITSFKRKKQERPLPASMEE